MFFSIFLGRSFFEIFFLIFFLNFYFFDFLGGIFFNFF